MRRAIPVDRLGGPLGDRNGLTTASARDRRAAFGPNDIVEVTRRGNGTYADFDGDGAPDIAGLCSLPLPGLRSAISIVRGLSDRIFSNGFE